jgi:peroxiredoxin
MDSPRVVLSIAKGGGDSAHSFASLSSLHQGKILVIFCLAGAFAPGSDEERSQWSASSTFFSKSEASFVCLCDDSVWVVKAWVDAGGPGSEQGQGRVTYVADAGDAAAALFGLSTGCNGVAFLDRSCNVLLREAHTPLLGFDPIHLHRSLSALLLLQDAADGLGRNYGASGTVPCCPSSWTLGSLTLPLGDPLGLVPRHLPCSHDSDDSSSVASSADSSGAPSPRSGGKDSAKGRQAAASLAALRFSTWTARARPEEARRPAGAASASPSPSSSEAGGGLLCKRRLHRQRGDRPAGGEYGMPILESGERKDGSVSVSVSAALSLLTGEDEPQQGGVPLDGVPGSQLEEEDCGSEVAALADAPSGPGKGRRRPPFLPVEPRTNSTMQREAQKQRR